MWVHIVIFMLTAGFMLFHKTGWIRLEALGDKNVIRLFLAVAVCGNFLGMAFTLAGSGEPVYTEGYKLPKETAGMYEEEFKVSVSGEKEKQITIQIPEKETEEQEETSAEADQDPQEEELRELQEMIEQYNRTMQDPDYYYLPAEWEGKSLEWSRPEDNSGALLASLSLLAAFAVMVKKAGEVQERAARQAEQLLMDYPGMVMKFSLLVQAGMTARKAFQKMADDYRRRTPGAGRFAYEAMAAACYEMDSGVAELEAYRRFGERCGQMKYKTFSTLLIQNLQKGSRRMADILEQEALEAWDERKRKARVLGETAATKLLLPMVLMLAVVMALL